MRILLVAAVGSVVVLSAAAAQTPAAIVEDIKGNVPGVEFMDYVQPGKIIKLGASGSIVLSYLASCVRETIRGGVVVIGTEESKVSLADINSEKVDCDGRRNQLSDREAVQSAATTFRSMASSAKSQPAEKPMTIYGLSPVFETTQPGQLVIERIDRAGSRDEVTLDSKTLVKGRFYDMAKAGKSLQPGALYAASLGGRKVAFKVDAMARPGAAPIVGRLIKL